MEEEDSQDELINKNQAHGKRKRPTVWDISGKMLICFSWRYSSCTTSCEDANELESEKNNCMFILPP